MVIKHTVFIPMLVIRHIQHILHIYNKTCNTCDDMRCSIKDNEVRKVSSNKNNTLSNMIDGKIGNENIYLTYLSINKNRLYNSVSYDNHEMNNLMLKLNEVI